MRNKRIRQEEEKEKEEININKRCEEEESDEIEEDFKHMVVDKSKMFNEMVSIKNKYQSIINTIYTIICLVVMLIALCNVCKYNLLCGVIFMIALTLLHCKRYVLSPIYQALNIPYDKKQQ